MALNCFAGSKDIGYKGRFSVTDYTNFREYKFQSVLFVKSVTVIIPNYKSPYKRSIDESPNPPFARKAAIYQKYFQ